MDDKSEIICVRRYIAGFFISTKVMSVTEGKNRIAYGYHVDGQLATVTKGKVTEEFTWDGLALVKRGMTSYMNEPHPGGGAPVVSSNGGVMFNDILGTTLGVSSNDGYASSSMTTFGDVTKSYEEIFFTGKPYVDGLGHAFLMRNYRADLGKWPTAVPLGYPDGWNQMAYCGNRVVNSVDYLGGCVLPIMDGWEYYYQYCRKYEYLEKRWDMDIVMGNSFIDNLSDLATVFGGVDALCKVLLGASIIPASVAAGASIASLTSYLSQNITSGDVRTINIAVRQGERMTNDWHQHIWKRRIGE